MLLSTKKIFQKCYGKYGIAGVNVWCMEQIHALFSAAQKANAPFIVQTTTAARKYASPDMILSMISAAARIYPNTVFAIHLDHGNKEQAFDCIDSGSYNSVMIDASHTNFDANVKVTREVVEKAHEKGITVEAELKGFSNLKDSNNIICENYTQPSCVEVFVEQTNSDSLAVALGTSQGPYKFSGGTKFQISVLKEIQKRLPEFPLVLHGGSSVNVEEIQRINAAGGRLGTDAKGVSDNEILKAIEHGICKINIETDAWLIWTRVHREFFKLSPATFNPIGAGNAFMNAFERFSIEKFESYRAVGKVSELKLL